MHPEARGAFNTSLRPAVSMTPERSRHGDVTHSAGILSGDQRHFVGSCRLPSGNVPGTWSTAFGLRHQRHRSVIPVSLTVSAVITSPGRWSPIWVFTALAFSHFHTTASCCGSRTQILFLVSFLLSAGPVRRRLLLPNLKALLHRHNKKKPETNPPLVSVDACMRRVAD